jgi:transcriptional regulator with XRE-family HTH domain
MPKKKPSPELPICERLRIRRVDVLGKSVRDMAKVLDASPIHISDIETGKRTPSDDLLVRIANAYGLPESELRSGFSRAPEDVNKLVTETPVSVEKVPEFLRSARGLSAEQWDWFIREAKKRSDPKDRTP